MADAFVHPACFLRYPGVEFRAPLHWEITGYEWRGEDAARFSFADETAPKMQFSTRKVPASPDMRRIWDDVHCRHTGRAASGLSFRELPSGVLTATAERGERFYASRYIPGRQLLAEWIFPEYTPAAWEEALPMLRKFTENAPRDGYLAYAMFGLELAVPESFALDEIRPYPLDVTLSFENRRHHRLDVHRLGMASIQLGEDTVENFYHRYLYAKKVGVKSCVRGADGEARAVFRLRGHIGLEMLLGSWWRGEGMSFLHPAENRIYAFEHIAPHSLKEREAVEKIFPVKWQGRAEA